MLNATNFKFATASTDSKTLAQCANIHIQQITGGFLSSLGEKVLTRVYSSIAASPHSFIITAKRDEQVIGFICGSFDTGKLYKQVLLKNGIRLSLACVKHIFSLRTIRKIWETLAYPKQALPTGIPDEEILNFCVAPNTQRSGLGTQLMNKLTQRFRDCGVTSIRIVTGAEQESAISFYEKIGAQRVHQFEVHRGIQSIIFKYDITN